MEQIEIYGVVNAPATVVKPKTQTNRHAHAQTDTTTHTHRYTYMNIYSTIIEY